MPDSPAITALFERIGSISSIPSVAIQIISVANNKDASVQDMLDVISTDPAFATKVLRTVNSAEYGLKNRVGDLKSAIAMLGFREVRNLAVTVHVADMFRGGTPHRY